MPNSADTAARINHHGVAITLAADPAESHVCITHAELPDRRVLVTPDPVAGWRIRAPGANFSAVIHAANPETVLATPPCTTKAPPKATS